MSVIRNEIQESTLSYFYNSCSEPAVHVLTAQIVCTKPTQALLLTLQINVFSIKLTRVIIVSADHESGC